MRVPPPRQQLLVSRLPEAVDLLAAEVSAAAMIVGAPRPALPQAVVQASADPQDPPVW